MLITADIARDLAYDEFDEEIWERIGEQKIIGHERWDVGYSQIFLHKPTTDYYNIVWWEGATECQDHDAFEYWDERSYNIVYPITELVVRYKPIPNECPKCHGGDVYYHEKYKYFYCPDCNKEI